MDDEVDLSGHKEGKREGRFGGRGHSQACIKQGPVEKVAKPSGFFADRGQVDTCRDCGQEIYF